jgi:hypothetical protein
MTDFLSSDGEKQFRNRDDEFIDTIESKKELMEIWGSPGGTTRKKEAFT